MPTPSASCSTKQSIIDTLVSSSYHGRTQNFGKWGSLSVPISVWAALNLLIAASQRFTVLLHTYFTVCSDKAMQQSLSTVYSTEYRVLQTKTKMEAVNTHTKQNKQIKHTFTIHCLLRPPSCNMHTPAALQPTFQAIYLLHFHRALHSGRRHVLSTHVTLCCSK